MPAALLCIGMKHSWGGPYCSVTPAPRHPRRAPTCLPMQHSGGTGAGLLQVPTHHRLHCSPSMHHPLALCCVRC